MKIEDILNEELINPEQTEKSYHGNFKRNFKIPSKPNLGAGARSKVKADPTDPHMAIKFTKNPLQKENEGFDRYPEFIKYLITHKIENPHFPKVYKMSKISDKNQRFIYTYRLEKLIPIDQISEEEFSAFIQKTFTENSEHYNTLMDDNQPFDHKLTMLGVIFNHIITYGDSEHSILQESLSEALQILKKILIDLNATSDVYYKNIMWRRGGQGLTVVFIDPI